MKKSLKNLSKSMVFNNTKYVRFSLVVHTFVLLKKGVNLMKMSILHLEKLMRDAILLFSSFSRKISMHLSYPLGI